MFSKKFINEVKSATDLIALAKEYTDLNSCGGGIWQGCCPHPDHRDSTPSFRVWDNNKGKNTLPPYDHSWACMGCHYGKKNTNSKDDKIYGSDCFAFLQWVSKGKVSWRDAVLNLAKRAGIQPEQEAHEKDYRRNYIRAFSYSKNIPSIVRSYLHDRGLSDQDIDDYMIGFNGERITFPLFDRYRRVLGFSKRKFQCDDDNVPKYINSATSAIFNKGAYFYGIHLLDMSAEEIIVTEGQIDVILAQKYKLNNIVAPLGTAFTEQHADMIKSWGMIPIFANDGDDAGMKSTRKAINLMAERGIYSKIMIMPTGLDMADLANKLQLGLQEYIMDNAITYFQMMLQTHVDHFEAKVNEARLRYYPAVKEVLDQIQNPDERAVMVNYVQNKMGLML